MKWSLIIGGASLGLLLLWLAWQTYQGPIMSLMLVNMGGCS
jgi:hypothetical protein